jgi:probable addiction module antidote protein
MISGNILNNTGDVHQLLIDSLKEPENAKMYLSVALEEYQEDDDAEAFLLALRNVAEAKGGLGKLAKDTKLNRQNLYRTLSSKGNPGIITLGKILKALGFQFSIEQSNKEANIFNH